MKEYMKMSDVFGPECVVTQKLVGDAYELTHQSYGHVCVVNTNSRADVIAHAINSQDELVSKLDTAESTIYEVERVLSEMQRNGAFWLDDVIAEVECCIKMLSQ